MFEKAIGLHLIQCDSERAMNKKLRCNQFRLPRGNTTKTN